MDGMDAEDLGGASFGSEQEHYRKLVEKLDNVMFIMFEFLQKKWYVATAFSCFLIGG